LWRAGQGLRRGKNQVCEHAKNVTLFCLGRAHNGVGCLLRLAV